MSDWFAWLGEQVGGPCAVRIEQRMFDLAASMVAGYAGGHWGVSFVGDVPVPELPASLGLGSRSRTRKTARLPKLIAVRLRSPSRVSR